MERRNFTYERERLLSWAEHIWTEAMIDSAVTRIPTKDGIECDFHNGTFITIYPERWVIKVSDEQKDEVMTLIRESDRKTVTVEAAGLGEISYIQATDINGVPTEEVVSVFKDGTDDYALDINIDNPNLTVKDILETRCPHDQEACQRVIAAYEELEGLMPRDLRHKGSKTEAEELIDQIIAEQEEYMRLDEELDSEIEF